MTTDVCVRVRAFVSLDLDGELSEFERSIVDAHVEDCAGCRMFRSAAAGSTAALRAAPLERVTYSFTVPRRASRLAPLSAAAAAAAALFVAGFATALSPLDSTENGPRFTSRTEVQRTFARPGDRDHRPNGGASVTGVRAL